MFGIDWNGDGVVNGFDMVMDLMILDDEDKRYDSECNGAVLTDFPGVYVTEDMDFVAVLE